MRRFIIGIAVLVITGLAACTKQEQPKLSKSAIEAKADSIVNSRKADIERQAQEDLDRRLSIEVKPKVDSILQRQMAAMAKDTAGHRKDSTRKK